jgi:hypothetical protein
MRIADLPGWPGYAVTEDGRVISFMRRRSRGFGGGSETLMGDEGREVASFDRKDRRGQPTRYRSVCLSRDGRSRNLYVHELVLLAFVGPRPAPDIEVLHRNGHGSDNRLENLRYGTVQENADDRELHGTVHRGDAWYRARGLPPPEIVGAFDDLLAP